MYFFPVLFNPHLFQNLLVIGILLSDRIEFDQKISPLDEIFPPGDIFLDKSQMILSSLQKFGSKVEVDLQKWPTSTSCRRRWATST